MPKRRTRGLSLTRNEVLSEFIYNQEEASFTRKSGRYAGKISKSKTPDGFYVASIGGLNFPVHHLVWLIHSGSYPVTVVVHLNGDRSDNRLSNLEMRAVVGSEELTHQRLTDVLSFNQKTGEFIWRKSLGCRGATAGNAAGHLCKERGYHVISVDWVTYGAHRLAWFYTHGKWPKLEIDHENGVRNDNRMTNLREADDAQQSWNSGIRSDSSTGITGVSKLSGDKGYRAYIQKHGKVQYLGNYPKLEDATAVRRAAEIEKFGEFARAS